MDAAPSTSTAISPPKKRHQKGHLALAEKQSVLNVMKIVKLENPNWGICAQVDQVSLLLGLAQSTIYRILKEYKQKGELSAPKIATGRPSLIKTFDEQMKNEVRKVVHSFFFKNELPTLNKILNEIKNQPELPHMCRSTLHRLMKEINFRYLKRNRKSLLIEKDEIVTWRRKYLRTIKVARAEGMPIYYLDETWLNEGHTKQKVWQDTAVRSKRQAFIEGLSTGLKNPSGKGKRLIILHVGSENGFVNDSLLVFEGKKTTDYHEEMNAQVFEEWFENMLPKLAPNALIVMDNASYHSRRTEKIPTTSTKKSNIQMWLQSKNIEYNQDMVRAELLDLVRLNKEKYNSYVIDEMAQRFNKTVLRLPPYHCELNPIELIWAQIKTEVASRNTTFKLADVKRLLYDAISNVTVENWKKCIDHIIKEENKMWQLDGLTDTLQESIIISLGGHSDDSDDSISSDTDTDL